MAKFTNSTKTEIIVHSVVSYLRTTTICSAFTPEYQYDISNIKLLRNVLCQKTMCSGILCVHKICFNLSAEATLNVFNASPCVRCAVFPLRNQKTRFVSRFRQKIFIFEDLQKSFQDVIGEV